MAVPALGVATFEQEIFPILLPGDAYVFSADVHRLKCVAALNGFEAGAFAQGVELRGGYVRGSVALIVAAAPVHERDAAQAGGESAAAVAVAVVEVTQPHLVAEFVADDAGSAELAGDGVGVETDPAAVVAASVRFQNIVLRPDGVGLPSGGFVPSGAYKVDVVHNPVAVIVVVAEIHRIEAESQGIAHGFIDQHVLAVGVVGSVV